MMVREACPACGAERYKRNGHTHTGKQNHQCKACGRQFVLDATNHVITVEQRTLVERLLREKISLHGICRAVGISIRWLMHFIATCFAALPDHPHMRPVASPRDVIIGHLEVEADEMWSFVKKKSEQTMDLDRHGQVDTAKHGVPRRELQSRESAAVVGESCCDVPRAGDVLYRLIDIRLYRE